MLHRSITRFAPNTRKIMPILALRSHVICRTTERLGSLHVLDSLICRHTAHIVVDLQNGFVVRSISALRAGSFRTSTGSARRCARLADSWSNCARRNAAPHDRSVQPRCLRPCDLAEARCASAGPQGAAASLRRIRTRLVRSARDPAGAQHRPADAAAKQEAVMA
jgi:hypothetical protein